MPPLGLVLGRVDFSSLFVVLDRSKGIPASLADAKTQGVPVIAYGQLMNDAVSFAIVAFAVFLLIKQVNRLKRAPEAAVPNTTECPFCATSIPLAAKRCPHCTSALA
jgi:large conductance mechanosensitive channel